MANSFPAFFPQKVRQTIALPLQGRVFPQMCALSAHHLPQKPRTPLFRVALGSLNKWALA